MFYIKTTAKFKSTRFAFIVTVRKCGIPIIKVLQVSWQQNPHREWERTKNQITWVEGRGKETGSVRSWCVENPQVGQGDDQTTTTTATPSFNFPTWLTVPASGPANIGLLLLSKCMERLAKLVSIARRIRNVLRVWWCLMECWGHVCGWFNGLLLLLTIFGTYW